MIQLQTMPPGWPAVMPYLPKRKVGFKVIDQGGALQEAKQIWADLGRDPKELVTNLRHYGFRDIRTLDWGAAVAHYRREFPTFIDATFREKYARYTDRIQGANETTSTSTWNDPADKARALTAERAMAWVWNNDYRRQADFAHIKLVLLSSPVTNRVPREIFELSVEQDCPIDYRAYWECKGGVQVEAEWAFHSGAWGVWEQEYGIYPEWDFGEAGPYDGTTAGGWLAKTCLNGDLGLLAESTRRFVRKLMATYAYRTGRVITPYHYISGNTGWPYYELDAEALKAIAGVYTSEGWDPGQEINMNEAEKRQALLTELATIDSAAKRAVEIVNTPTTNYLFQVKLKYDLNVRSVAGSSLASTVLRLAKAGSVLSVYETVRPAGWTVDWYRVGPGEWVSGHSFYSEKI